MRRWAAAGLLVVALAGCSSSSDTTATTTTRQLADRMVAWRNANLAELRVLYAAGERARAQSFSERRNCPEVWGGITKLRGQAFPVPDPAIDRALTSALALYEKAARQCFDDNNRGDPPTMATDDVFILAAKEMLPVFGSLSPTPATTAVAAAATPPTTVAGLSRSEACDRFYAITGDLTLDDAESAQAYGVLARQTADPALAAAIQRIADLFARHAEQVPTGDVTSLCRR